MGGEQGGGGQCWPCPGAVERCTDLFSSALKGIKDRVYYGSNLRMIISQEYTFRYQSTDTMFQHGNNFMEFLY